MALIHNVKGSRYIDESYDNATSKGSPPPRPSTSSQTTEKTDVEKVKDLKQARQTHLHHLAQALRKHNIHTDLDPQHYQTQVSSEHVEFQATTQPNLPPIRLPIAAWKSDISQRWEKIKTADGEIASYRNLAQQELEGLCQTLQEYGIDSTEPFKFTLRAIAPDITQGKTQQLWQAHNADGSSVINLLDDVQAQLLNSKRNAVKALHDSVHDEADTPHQLIAQKHERNETNESSEEENDGSQKKKLATEAAVLSETSPIAGSQGEPSIEEDNESGIDHNENSGHSAHDNESVENSEKSVTDLLLEHGGDSNIYGEQTSRESREDDVKTMATYLKAHLKAGPEHLTKLDEEALKNKYKDFVMGETVVESMVDRGPAFVDITNQDGAALSTGIAPCIVVFVKAVTDHNGEPHTYLGSVHISTPEDPSKPHLITGLDTADVYEQTYKALDEKLADLDQHPAEKEYYLIGGTVGDSETSIDSCTALVHTAELLGLNVKACLTPVNRSDQSVDALLTKDGFFYTQRLTDDPRDPVPAELDWLK